MSYKPTTLGLSDVKYNSGPIGEGLGERLSKYAIPLATAVSMGIVSPAQASELEAKVADAKPTPITDSARQYASQNSNALEQRAYSQTAPQEPQQTGKGGKLKWVLIGVAGAAGTTLYFVQTSGEKRTGPGGDI